MKRYFNSCEEIKENKNDIKKLVENGICVVTYNDSEEVSKDGLVFDKEEEYYKAGYYNTKCKECNEMIESKCGTKNNNENALKDIAYCDNCDLLHTREREYLVDPNPTPFNFYNWDRNYEDSYNCSFCQFKHKYSKPVTSWKTPDPELKSYETITINCKCGEIINNPFSNVGDKEQCSCGRVYEFNLVND